MSESKKPIRHIPGERYILCHNCGGRIYLEKELGKASPEGVETCPACGTAHALADLLKPVK